MEVRRIEYDFSNISATMLGQIKKKIERENHGAISKSERIKSEKKK